MAHDQFLYEVVTYNVYHTCVDYGIYSIFTVECILLNEKILLHFF